MMKKIVLFAIASLLAVAPAGAQGKKVIKQAKEDSKLVVSQLKEDGYKPIDNVKLDDAVNSYLTTKYSDKSVTEVIGKATSGDLNDAKAKARQDAIGGYPAEEVANSFFVYKKNKKKFDVVCYALVNGSSAAAAGVNATQALRKGEGTAASLAAAKAAQEAKDAKAQAKKAEKKAKSDAKKAEKKAQKKIEKAQKQADAKAQKAIDKAQKEKQKALDKLNQ